jgi:ligand-binding sensor domain-containing protein
MQLPLLLLTTLILLFSCHGQTRSPEGRSTKPIEPPATGDTVQELSDNIMVVYQDTKNNYWFGSWKDGLYQYDGKTILHYTSKTGLPDNRIEEIKEDRLGNIYINTAKGLSQYNGRRFSTWTKTFVPERAWSLQPDDLWFINLEQPGYVYRLDENGLSKLKLPKNKIGEDYIAKHPGYTIPYALYCIYKDSKQNVWFGTAALGAFRYNGKSFDWITEPDVTEMHEGPANGVRSIAEDQHGDFWFNTEYRYRIYNKTPLAKTDTAFFYERIKSIGWLDGQKEGPLNEYLSIAKDNKNNLWMATYLNGVWRYDGEKIQHFPIRVNGRNIPVFCLFKDNAGEIWLGTQENGVFKFDGNGFEKFAP